ncbi:hypothetical protein KI387_012968, partial [Taxus chinensis]
MEMCMEGDFTEDSVVVVIANEEEVSSQKELVLTVGLQSIKNESSHNFCSAHGVGRNT